MTSRVFLVMNKTNTYLGRTIGLDERGYCRTKVLSVVHRHLHVVMFDCHHPSRLHESRAASPDVYLSVAISGLGLWVRAPFPAHSRLRTLAAHGGSAGAWPNKTTTLLDRSPGRNPTLLYIRIYLHIPKPTPAGAGDPGDSGAEDESPLPLPWCGVG